MKVIKVLYSKFTNIIFHRCWSAELLICHTSVFTVWKEGRRGWPRQDSYKYFSKHFGLLDVV